MKGGDVNSYTYPNSSPNLIQDGDRTNREKLRNGLITIQLADLKASYNIEKQYKIITFAPIKKNQSDRRMQMREKAIILGSR